MLKIGEIRKDKNHREYIWLACKVCGKERWVSPCKINRPNYTGLCNDCNRHLMRGENSPTWKGGRCKTTNGHIMVKLCQDDFFYPMANKAGYVLEHRLVMAKHLGRCLQPWEIVHHKGIRHIGIENKSDNLMDNLELTISGSHSLAHSKGYRDGYRKGLVDGRTKQIEELKQEIRLLQWQIKESRGTRI